MAAEVLNVVTGINFKEVNIKIAPFDVTVGSQLVTAGFYIDAKLTVFGADLMLSAAGQKVCGYIWTIYNVCELRALMFLFGSRSAILPLLTFRSKWKISSLVLICKA